MIKLLFNNTKYIAGLLLLTALTPSCKKLIDIPANPPTQITEAQQFADSASTMTAVAGVYSYTPFGKGFMFNDAYQTICTGLSSDELSPTSTFDPYLLQLYDYGVTNLNTYANTLWANPYAGIYPINAILSNVTASNNLSAAFKTQITGEMKCVRAFYYFNLVNLYGGVPIVTSTDYKTTATLPRVSADSVYGLILADLADARQKLPAAYPSSGHLRPNLYTVLSLLAKVQLYRQQWQAAYDAANTVIGSGDYSLETDPNNVFLDGSQEAIWQIPATNNNDVTQEAHTFIPYNNTVIPQYLVTPFLQNAFEPGDLRLQNWIKDYVVNGQDYYIPYKYKNVSPYSPTTEDYMLFRLAELYLIRAEAAAQLGNTVGALADLNQVRSRAGLTPSTASTQPDILTAIMHERQVELFTEWGSRWFDLKRTGAAGTVLSAEKTGWKPYQALYPVSKTQLQFNPALTQNPGY